MTASPDLPPLPLAALATIVAVHGLAAAGPPDLARTGGLLDESRRLVDDGPPRRTDARCLERAAAALAGLADEHACAEPGLVYLYTGGAIDLWGEGALVLELSGTHGAAEFAFASGTSVEDARAAINALAGRTGVRASAASPSWFTRLESVEAGADAFVSARQLTGTSGRLRLEPTASPGHELTDFGDDGVPGDADCDRIVGPADLQAVLDGWGSAVDDPGDLDGDGLVGLTDLLLVLAGWTV